MSDSCASQVESLGTIKASARRSLRDTWSRSIPALFLYESTGPRPTTSSQESTLNSPRKKHFDGWYESARHRLGTLRSIHPDRDQHIRNSVAAWKGGDAITASHCSKCWKLAVPDESRSDERLASGR